MAGALLHQLRRPTFFTRDSDFYIAYFSEIAKTNKRGSKFVWDDLFASSPLGLIEWASQYSDSGVMGEAEKATAEKGKIVFEEASRNLADFIAEYQGMKIELRTCHQAQEPTFPLAFPTE